MSDSRRRLSKVVFGQEHRLALMLAIADLPDGVFTLTDLVGRLQFRSASSAQDPLRALLIAGLVEKIDIDPGNRFKWYRRVDSPAWEWARDLAARAALIEKSPMDLVF
jgi:hypothetical protein